MQNKQVIFDSFAMKFVIIRKVTISTFYNKVKLPNSFIYFLGQTFLGVISALDEKWMLNSILFVSYLNSNLDHKSKLTSVKHVSQYLHLFH